MCKLWDKGAKVAFKKFKVLWSAKGCLPKILPRYILEYFVPSALQKSWSFICRHFSIRSLVYYFTRKWEKNANKQIYSKTNKGKCHSKYSRKLFLNELYLKSTLWWNCLDWCFHDTLHYDFYFTCIIFTYFCHIYILKEKTVSTNCQFLRVVCKIWILNFLRKAFKAIYTQHE